MSADDVPPAGLAEFESRRAGHEDALRMVQRCRYGVDPVQAVRDAVDAIATLRDEIRLDAFAQTVAGFLRAP
jgi:hypothetical protein